MISIYPVPTHLSPFEGHFSNNISKKDFTRYFYSIPDTRGKCFIMYSYKAAYLSHASEKNTLLFKSIHRRIQNFIVGTKFRINNSDNKKYSTK